MSAKSGKSFDLVLKIIIAVASALAGALGYASV